MLLRIFTEPQQGAAYSTLLRVAKATEHDMTAKTAKPAKAVTAATPAKAVRATRTRTPAARLASAKRPGVREQAAQTTRDNILRAATKVFARYGYDGGSVEKISQSAKSFDRMIYYYFGSKEGLFIEVLEETYRRFNEAESELVLDESQPVQALTAVTRFMWSYYQENPEFITLLNTENLHRGVHIAKSLRARSSSGVDGFPYSSGLNQRTSLCRPSTTARKKVRLRKSGAP